jgi:hypothetical protein
MRKLEYSGKGDHNGVVPPACSMFHGWNNIILAIN